MSRLSPLLLAAALLLALLSLPVSAAVRRPIRRNRMQQLPTSSWTELQSELQSELDAGLDESALSHLEARAVSAKGTQCALAQPRHCDTSGAITVFLDISIDTGMARSRPTVSRLTLQLFNATAPRTVLNFLTICDGAHRGFSYRGNRFHRIITGFMAQGGDITAGNGRGGKSIYGRTFKDETFACGHVCRGALSMANSGPDSNGSQVGQQFIAAGQCSCACRWLSASRLTHVCVRPCCWCLSACLQFFLTFAPTPWLDGQ